MRHLPISAIFLIACMAPVASQEKIPPRFQALAKDGRIRLTRILGTPELHPAFGATSAFAADGKTAIYVEDLTTVVDEKPVFRSRLVVDDPASNEWPREIDLPGKNVTALHLTADGTKVLLAGETFVGKTKDPDTYLALWDLKSGKELRSFKTSERQIVAVSLAPDEATALTGTAENLKRFDLKTGKELRFFGVKDKSTVTVLAHLPGGERFLAGFRGGEVKLFDVKKTEAIRTFKVKGDHTFIWHLAISSDGKRFASADFQSSVSLWETDTGKEINTLRPEKKTDEEAITGLTLADDAKTVLIAWQKVAAEADDFNAARLSAWNGETNKTLWSKAASYRGRLPMLAKGDSLQVGGGPNVFEIWSIKSGMVGESRGGHKSPVNAIGVTAEGDYLSGGAEGVLYRWNKGRIAHKERAHKGAVTAFAMSRNREQWLTAGADLVIRGWPPDATRPIEFKKKHTGPITSLAFNSTAIWAASGSGDRSVRTWFVATGEEIASFLGHSEGVSAVAFSPDNRWLASASDDTTIRLWPILGGKLDPDRDPIVLEKHTKPVTCLAFTPDGKRLLSGGQDQKLIVWDWQKGKTESTTASHKNWITSILMLDDKTALTTSDDLSICMWELPAGKELARVDFGVVGDCPRCLARAGGNRILVGSSSWLIYEFEVAGIAKTKSVPKSSKE